MVFEVFAFVPQLRERERDANKNVERPRTYRESLPTQTRKSLQGRNRHMAHHYQITRQDLARAERHFKHHRSPSGHGGGGKMSALGLLGETAAVQGSALAMGVLTGRFGPLSLGPVPVEGIAFLALSGLALSGWAGKASNVAANVGQGVLAGYSNDFGKGLGQMWRQSAGLSPWASTPQVSAGAGGRRLGAARAPMTPAELAAMAHAVR
jgi:hypothetical protein